MEKLNQCSSRALFSRTWQALRLLAIIATTASFLSGCGFHLRENYLVNTKLHKLYLVTSDPYSLLTQTLKRQLRKNNVTLVNAPSDLVPILTLNSPTITSRTVAVYPDGSDAEYELSYHLSGTVTTIDNQQIPIEVQLHRDFTSDSTQALAKMREQQLIDNEMNKMAAEQVIRKLAAVNFR
ncbi:MAG: LPS-assembly lipoprotein LptE [Candidatus Celerinatantimonas neptuna]|nr:MAG: LPS-assembly lipoprotein LptE [Candidatus Celerinatantimonas neptuna]